jgi:hypothetical protein
MTRAYASAEEVHEPISVRRSFQLMSKREIDFINRL